MSFADKGSMALAKLGELDAGLPNKIGTIPDVDGFGDSGDVFNHNHWRALFLLLSNSDGCRKSIVGLATQYLLRGRMQKIEYKGQAVTYSLNLTGVNTKKLEELFGIKATNLLSFKIVFATESTRVAASVLTPERFKCAIRPIVVPSMMKANRMGATSGAIGFDVMAKDLVSAMNISKLIMASEEKDYKGKTKEEIIDECGMQESVLEDWRTIFSAAIANRVVEWMTLTAITSASVTQKEIYLECEKIYPGTIFWAGVHSMMTDVSNKKKAVEVTADIRARYENSNFYGDFKRKQIARGLMITKSVAYMECLEAAGPLMARYLKASTGVNEKEISIIDYVMKEASKRFMETKADVSVDVFGTASNDPQIALAALKAASSVLVADPVETKKLKE